MRVTGIMVLTVFLSAMLCGCQAQSDAVSVLPAIVEYPSAEDGNAAAFRQGAGGTVLYYANTSTKKFHQKECPYAQKIADNRLYICDDRQELIDNGYEPCGMCNP